MLLSYHHPQLVEAGLDEAGRGCYAGPVFAAAVILPKHFHYPLLNDSKQMTEEHRYLLRPIIEEQAIAYAVAQVSNEEIDRINILQASLKAMHLAVNALQLIPELLLVDGNRFNTYPAIPHQCFVKGDGTYASIAAASVLAKTYRDDFLKQLHLQYPHYGWESNKGYGTLYHRKAIAEHGLCEWHRKSFRIKKEVSEIDTANEQGL